jgi:hypothetical protein
LTTCKRVNIPTFFFILAFVLSACGTATPTAEPQIVDVYATSTAQPWLTELYACAGDSRVILNLNAESPEIYLRVGEPEMTVSPAYKIDEEEILIVTHRESPVQNLSLEGAQDLFAQENPSVQVWVYSSDADLQEAFNQLVMKGRSVTSSAKVVVSPQNMSDILNSESSAIGILPRHWKMGNVREVASAGIVPVLAATKSEPQGAVIELISCLQNN